LGAEDRGLGGDSQALGSRALEDSREMGGMEVSRGTEDSWEPEDGRVEPKDSQAEFYYDTVKILFIQECRFLPNLDSLPQADNHHYVR